jgi:Fic family protein
MSRVIQRRWGAEPAGLARRDRRRCDYEAYVPDPLLGRRIRLEGGTAADVADAEAAIIRLNAEASTLVDTEALARLLLRAESVASSKIEGLEVGPRRLLRAEAALSLGEDPSDVTAAEVLGNVQAMAHAVSGVGPGDPITLELLTSIHQQLLARSRVAEHAGRFREEQNWIGGSDYNPCSAVFVPPPPELVEELMEDLVAFSNEDSLPAVAQAAMAHAHFETIHPFVDGNGRVGRTLIHLVLRRRAVATHVTPPISLVLATWARDYTDGLNATRYRGSALSAAAHDGTNLWIGRFAAACRRAVADATSFEQRGRSIEQAWRQRLGRVRRNSAADLLLGALIGAPVLTVRDAAQLIDRSFVQTNEAVSRLAGADILRQVNVGRRNRAYEAHEIIDAFTDLERQLTSPEGDTRTSKPSRRTPARHHR